jgi:hypothetical protein
MVGRLSFVLLLWGLTLAAGQVSRAGYASRTAAWGICCTDG